MPQGVFSPYHVNTNIQPITFRWSKTCQFCGVSLLNTETVGWCCGPQGRYRHLARPLPPLPAEYNYFIHDPQVSSKSRKLNNLFSFAALQAEREFPNTQGGFVAIQGARFHF